MLAAKCGADSFLKASLHIDLQDLLRGIATNEKNPPHHCITPTKRSECNSDY